jgi:hypothetical protein
MKFKQNIEFFFKDFAHEDLKNLILLKGCLEIFYCTSMFTFKN